MGVRDMLVCRGELCAGGWRRESKLAKGDRSLRWAVFDRGAGLNATMIWPITNLSLNRAKREKMRVLGVWGRN